MQNLQNMAFKNDMTNQLKEQSKTLDERTSTQLRGVVQAVEETRAEVAQVRQYNLKSTEDKILKTNAQIAYQLKLKKGPNEDRLLELQQNLARYTGLSEFESRGKGLRAPSYDPPAGTGTQSNMSLPTAPVAQAGGGAVSKARSSSVTRAHQQQEFVFERAPTSSKVLSATDVNAPLYAFAEQQDVQLETFVSGGQADIFDSIQMYESNVDSAVSSGNPFYDRPVLTRSPDTGPLKVRTSVIKSLTANEARNSLSPKQVSNIQANPWSPAGPVSTGPTSRPKRTSTAVLQQKVNSVQEQVTRLGKRK
jgi:hypothetical protein